MKELKKSVEWMNPYLEECPFGKPHEKLENPLWYLLFIVIGIVFITL